MPKKEKLAYEEYISVVKIQNDVIDNAKNEGYYNGHVDGRTVGLKEGLAEAARNEEVRHST